MSNITAETSSNAFYQARCAASAHNEQLRSREGAADIMSIDRGRLYRIEKGLINPYPEEIHLMAEMCNDRRKRQGISRVSDNRQYALVQIWYRMEKKASARPQIATAPRAKTATGNRPPLPRQNDRIRHFPAQPIIYPLNSIKRFPAPVSTPQAYYDCCNSHM